MGGGEGGSVVINWDKSDVDGSALGRVAGGKGSGERRKKGQRESICIIIYLVSYPLSTLPFSSSKGGLCSRL